MSEGSAASPEGARIVVDDQPISFRAGDSVALAVLRTGAHPARGGTLCLAGDCGNCLAQVDGIAYVRTCQTPAVPGLVVRRRPHRSQMPPLPVVASSSVTSSPAGREIEVRRAEVDVAIVGGGASGLAARADAERAGRSVLVLDAGAGDEVVAIYAGGMLVVRTRSGMLHVTRRRSWWRRARRSCTPSAPATSSRACSPHGARSDSSPRASMARSGPPSRSAGPDRLAPVTPIPGRLVRFEGDGRVRAVVTADDTGAETTTPCAAWSSTLARPRGTSSLA